MQSLIDAHQVYLDSCSGIELMAYYAPCCQQLTRTPAAPDGEEWVTERVCIHCGDRYARRVSHDHIDVWLPVQPLTAGK